MKKIYTLSLAVAVALTANASQDLKLRTNAVSKTRVEGASATIAKNGLQLQALTQAELHQTQKAQASHSIEGEYTITINDCYFEDSVGEFEEDCTIARTGSTLILSCPYFPVEVHLEYDEASGKLTVKNEPLGLCHVGGGQYYIQFEPLVYDWNQGNAIPGTIYTAQFDATTGIITFPSDSGFAWIAYNDSYYEEPYSYVDAFDVIGLVSSAEKGDPNEDWTSLGNATLTDGWVLPAFGIDQNDASNKYKVELQQYKFDSNIYRLVDPYHGDCPAAQYNESSKTGYIQFDVTDPDHVLFLPVEAGFANSELEITKLYCINTIAVFTAITGTSVSETIGLLEANGYNVPYTTFKDGVVTLTSYKDNDQWVSDACFGIQGEQAAGYIWNDQNEKPIDMFAQIVFPTEINSVGDIAVSENNGPVRYYNLQGVEISEPTSGALVIRVQNGKAKKTLIK